MDEQTDHDELEPGEGDDGGLLPLDPEVSGVGEAEEQESPAPPLRLPAGRNILQRRIGQRLGG